MLILSSADVRKLLPMDECINAMSDAMVAASTAAVSIPPRIIAPLIDNSGFFAVMPGSAAAVYGAKVVSLHPNNPGQGLPAIQGFVTLFEHKSGTPLAIVEGATLTAIRTAAASGLATRALAPKTAASHGVLGTGVQAETHIDAIASVRKIENVVVWGRDLSRAREFAQRQSERTGLNIKAAEDARDAAACDVVSTVTASSEPVLKGSWLNSGVHVNLVGAHSATTREADSDVMKKARIYVDLMQSAMSEAGDILIAVKEGAISEKDIVGEIGHVISGKLDARASDREITVYKSLGIVAQDLFAANRAYAAAVARGFGTHVRLA